MKKLFINKAIIIFIMLYLINGQNVDFFDTLGTSIQNKNSLSSFYSKMEKLKIENSEEIKILVLGDSHIQADFFTGRIRAKLQKTYGTASRGYVIPRNNPNSPGQRDIIQYTSEGWKTITSKYSGRYENALDIYGLSMKKHIAQKSQAYMYVKTIDQSYDSAEIWFISHKHGGKINVSVNQGSLKTYSFYSDTTQISRIIITNKNGINHLKIYAVQDENFLNTQKSNYHSWNKAPVQIISFIMNHHKGGVTVDACGLNGARISTAALCDSASFNTQLKWRDYDLALICFGANDILYKKINTEKISRDFIEITDRISTTLPKCSIIMITPPDMLPVMNGIPDYKNLLPGNLDKVNSIINQTSEANKLAKWDQFSAMGGKGSVYTWRNNNFWQKDLIHANMRGYYLLADLFLNALLEIPVPTYTIKK